MQKSKLEIIEETAKFYGEDPAKRAIDGFGCAYLASSGNKCAVGRCMIRPTRGMAGAVDEFYGGIDELLKPEYRGHPTIFWQDLQDFHDLPSNWTKTGLSEQGEDILKYLKIKYS